MTTLNKECVKHTPNKNAISYVSGFADVDFRYTFCEVCEQNIDQFSFYDDDRGIVWTNWTVTKQSRPMSVVYDRIQQLKERRSVMNLEEYREHIEATRLASVQKAMSVLSAKMQERKEN